MLNKIEKSIFFPVIRITGFISAIILLLIILGGLIVFFSYDSTQKEKVHVSFESITYSLNPKISSQSSTYEEEKLKYSDKINKYISGENRQVLENWLDEYSTEKKEKQDFLDNLSEIISQAEKNKVNVLDYINEYRNLKQRNKKEDRFGINKYVDPTLKGVIAFSIAIIFLIFTVVVMLLLLLSIERNTRINGSE